MTVTLTELSPDLAAMDGGAARIFAAVNQSKWEQVIYYRCPPVIKHTGERHEQAGWIICGDSQSPKLADNVMRGYIPLSEFGFVKDSRNMWGPILSHPDGPRQFPLDQIIAYRWYHVDDLRRQWPGLPARYQRDQDLARLFPQLRDPDLKIKEYGCPNCRNRKFLEPRGLFQHLHNHHDFKTEDIFAWGEKMGIDFGDMLRDRAMTEVTFDPVDDTPEEEPEYAGFTVEDVTDGPQGRTAGRPRDARGRLLPAGVAAAMEDQT